MTIRRRDLIGCGLVLATGAASAHEAYPVRPIKLVVAYPAGGITDSVARVVAHGMSAHLGQQVVVDNRSGAAGLLGHSHVAAQAGDGYTLVVGAGGAMTINVQMQDKPPYHPERDFTPVSQLVASDAVLAVGKNFPANDLKQLIALLKASPQNYAYASAGTGNPTHLGMELFKSAAGVNATHVPFKGDNAAATAVIGGHVDVMVGVFASIAELVRSKELKVLASFGSKRSAAMGNVPTIAEQGFPEVKSMIWLGVFGPKRMPPAIQQKLNLAIKATLDDPQTRAKIEGAGSSVAYSTPEELRDLIATEYAKWGGVIRAGNIRAE